MEEKLSLTHKRILCPKELLARASQLLGESTSKRSNVRCFEPYTLKEAGNGRKKDITLSEPRRLERLQEEMPSTNNYGMHFADIYRGNRVKVSTNSKPGLVECESVAEKRGRLDEEVSMSTFRHHNDRTFEEIEDDRVVVTYILHAIEIERLLSVNKDLVMEAKAMDEEIENLETCIYKINDEKSKVEEERDRFKLLYERSLMTVEGLQNRLKLAENYAGKNNDQYFEGLRVAVKERNEPVPQLNGNMAIRPDIRTPLFQDPKNFHSATATNKAENLSQKNMFQEKIDHNVPSFTTLYSDAVKVISPMTVLSHNSDLKLEKIGQLGNIYTKSTQNNFSKNNHDQKGSSEMSTIAFPKQYAQLGDTSGTEVYIDHALFTEALTTTFKDRGDTLRRIEARKELGYRPSTSRTKEDCYRPLSIRRDSRRSSVRDANDIEAGNSHMTNDKAKNTAVENTQSKKFIEKPALFGLSSRENQENNSRQLEDPVKIYRMKLAQAETRTEYSDRLSYNSGKLILSNLLKRQNQDQLVEGRQYRPVMQLESSVGKERNNKRAVDMTELASMIKKYSPKYSIGKPSVKTTSQEAIF